MLIAQSSPALLLHSSTSKPAPFVRCVTIGDMECYKILLIAIHDTSVATESGLSRIRSNPSFDTLVADASTDFGAPVIGVTATAALSIDIPSPNSTWSVVGYLLDVGTTAMPAVIRDMECYCSKLHSVLFC